MLSIKEVHDLVKVFTVVYNIKLNLRMAFKFIV